MTGSVRRVAVVVTARPTYARVKTVLRAIEANPKLKLLLIAGASAVLEKYGEVASVMEEQRFEIVAKVYMVLEGENTVTMAKTTGLGIIELATVFDNLRPDVVVTVADRFETLATAIAAAYQNIPLAHIQGGEVTGSIDEKVRHAVTKLADLHFPSTELSAQRIIRMGEDPRRVYVTGCPSIDLAAEVRAQDLSLPDPFRRGVGPSFDLSGPYLIVIQHPVTTEYDAAGQQIERTLHAVHELGLPTLWFWPNVDAGSDAVSKGIRMFRERVAPPNIHFIRNMAPEGFLALLHRSACIAGNSSAAIREGSYLGVPAVNIGTRQAGREMAANVMCVGHDQQQIMDAVESQVRHGRYPTSALYGDGRAGERIAAHLTELPLTFEKKLAF